MKPIDAFYINQNEPVKSCLITLRDLILAYDSEHIHQKWYYRLPCFFYNDKLFAYLWVDKKRKEPYIAFYPGHFLEHPKLEQANRKNSKILRISPHEDIPLPTLNYLLDRAIHTPDFLKKIIR